MMISPKAQRKTPMAAPTRGGSRGHAPASLSVPAPRQAGPQLDGQQIQRLLGDSVKSPARRPQPAAGTRQSQTQRSAAVKLGGRISPDSLSTQRVYRIAESNAWKRSGPPHYRYLGVAAKNSTVAATGRSGHHGRHRCLEVVPIHRDGLVGTPFWTHSQNLRDTKQSYAQFMARSKARTATAQQAQTHTDGDSARLRAGVRVGDQTTALVGATLCHWLPAAMISGKPARVVARAIVDALGRSVFPKRWASVPEVLKQRYCATAQVLDHSLRDYISGDTVYGSVTTPKPFWVQVRTLRQLMGNPVHGPRTLEPKGSAFRAVEANAILYRALRANLAISACRSHLLSRISHRPKDATVRRLLTIYDRSLVERVLLHAQVASPAYASLLQRFEGKAESVTHPQWFNRRENWVPLTISLLREAAAVLGSKAPHRLGPKEIPDAVLFEQLAHRLAYHLSDRDTPWLQFYGYRPGKLITGAIGCEWVVFTPIDRNPYNRPSVVAFRGTQPTEAGDLIADVNRHGIGRHQMMANIGEIATTLAQCPSKPVVTGHSLGGALAQYVASYLPSMVSQVVTFQAPAIDAASVQRLAAYNDKQKPSQQVRSSHHIVQGDLVSNAGQARTAGTIHEYGLTATEAVPYSQRHKVYPLHSVVHKQGNYAHGSVKGLRDVKWAASYPTSDPSGAYANPTFQRETLSERARKWTGNDHNLLSDNLRALAIGTNATTSDGVETDIQMTRAALMMKRVSADYAKKRIAALTRVKAIFLEKERIVRSRSFDRIQQAVAKITAGRCRSLDDALAELGPKAQRDAKDVAHLRKIWQALRQRSR